jgi:hypothetical protein
MGKARQSVMVDRGKRAAMSKIESKALARIERAVRLLPLDGLGQLAEVEGEGSIVLAAAA